MRSTLFCSFCIVLLLSGCNNNDDDNSLTPAVASIGFATAGSAIAVGQEIEMSLQADNLSADVFAVSMQISFDQEVLAFSDSSGWVAGDLFGSNALTFVRTEESVIRLTVTRVQGTQPGNGFGTLCRLTFSGRAAGTSPLQIDRNELKLFDSTGVEIDLADIVINNAAMQVNQ
ncbi:MAG: cohesin domain-containing protein [bacterium]|nr:cohesin domain-containing protein [bacterium]